MNGFKSYLDTGEITDSFLTDFSFLVRKIYSGWSLKVGYHDFLGFCVDKITKNIIYFDPTKGKIETFVYTVIVNEARRVLSKYKREISDSDDVVRSVASREFDIMDLIDRVYSFAVRAYNLGIYVPQKQLIADYQQGIDSGAMCRAFSWLSANGGLL